MKSEADWEWNLRWTRSVRLLYFISPQLFPATDSRFLFYFSMQTEVKVNLFMCREENRKMRSKERKKKKHKNRRRTKGRGSAAQLIKVHHINFVASIAVVFVVVGGGGGGGDDSIFICILLFRFWRILEIVATVLRIEVLWPVFASLFRQSKTLRMPGYCFGTQHCVCRRIRVTIRARSQVHSPRKKQTYIFHHRRIAICTNGK